MAETLTIRTASSTEVIKVAVQGPQGPAGQGVPTGGSTGQVLRKASGTDYDTEWAAAGSGSGSVTSVALASSDLTIVGSPITSSGTITANVTVNGLTLNKLETIQTAHFLGRHGSGAGDVQPVSASQARTILNVADGAEANVQSNWTEADSGSDAFILNKPSTFAPAAHAADHAAGGSDPVFDQDLNTTDIVEFAEIYAAAFYINPDEDGNSVSLVSQGFEFTGPTAASTTRDNLGLGDAAVADIGTGSTQVAAGDHTHPVTDLSAGNHKIFYSDGSGEIVELALGATGTVLTSGGTATAPSFAAASGGVTAIGASAADILSVSGSDIVADDLGADRLYGWDDSESKAIGFTVGSGLSISGTTLTATATGTIGGSTGSTDNAILRADGTGGATLQDSALLIDDAATATQRNVTIWNREPAATSFALTASASTDTITATGHTFSNDNVVVFKSLAGGAGLAAEPISYFVRNAATNTFQVATQPSIFGGSVVNITTDYTSGTVELADNSIVITPKGNGAFILGPKPDGGVHGGNARGENAIDLQIRRRSATQVASGRNCLALGYSNVSSGSESIAIGSDNSSSGQGSVAIGGQRGGGNAATVTGSLAIGGGHTASGGYSSCLGGRDDLASGTSSDSQSTCVGGKDNRATADYSITVGGERVLADRYGMLASASGQFAARGDAQRARFVLRCKTTTNAAVEMALNGSTTYLTIPSGKVIFCNIKVVGVKSDGSAVATYERQYAAKNVAGTSSEVFAEVTIGTDNAASTSLDISTVDAGDYISIKPTGIASETWRWVASVDAVEVAYGT